MDEYVLEEKLVYFCKLFGIKLNKKVINELEQVAPRIREYLNRMPKDGQISFNF